MNAEEAKRIAQKAREDYDRLDKELERIMAEISRTAKLGHFQISTSTVSEAAIKWLRDNGYTAENVYGGECQIFWK